MSISPHHKWWDYFVIGVLWFALVSLPCGAAPNLTTLIAARMLQGIGGALLTPGSLAIIQASFHPEDQVKAIGAWSGLGGITTAVGPFLGGWLVAVASWRWIFLLKPAAGRGGDLRRAAPRAREPGPHRVRPARLPRRGAGRSRSGRHHLRAHRQERAGGRRGRGRAGRLPGDRSPATSPHDAARRLPLPPFSAANAVTFVLYAALGMVLFLVGLVLQRSLGYSPLTAGASLFPITVIMLVFSARSGALAQRIGPRLPMTVGPAVVGVGLLLMNRVQQGASLATPRRCCRRWWCSGADWP